MGCCLDSVAPEVLLLIRWRSVSAWSAGVQLVIITGLLRESPLNKTICLHAATDWDAKAADSVFDYTLYSFGPGALPSKRSSLESLITLQHAQLRANPGTTVSDLATRPVTPCYGGWDERSTEPDGQTIARFHWINEWRRNIREPSSWYSEMKTRLLTDDYERLGLELDALRQVVVGPVESRFLHVRLPLPFY